MARRHLIVGGGTAGMNAIRTIREEEAERSAITLVSAEKPYSRMVLPYYLDRSIAESHVFTATAKVLDKTGLTIADFDLIEMNEAFAAQVIACERELKFDRDRLNPNGGGISLGHPIGMSGARIILALAYELRATGKSLGLATLCISGGQGLAVVLERS